MVNFSDPKEVGRLLSLRERCIRNKKLGKPLNIEKIVDTFIRDRYGVLKKLSDKCKI